MFSNDGSPATRRSQWAIAGLGLLSLMALVVTAWILADFSREQQIVRDITRHLPASDLPEANELAGELQLQSRLSVLLILNIVASGVAVTMLVRAYRNSQRSLQEARVLANDILASIDQGIITTDRSATVLSINPRGREILDQTDDGIGIGLHDLPDEHATLNDICQHVLQHRDHVREHDYVINHNGNARTFRAGCSPLRDHENKHLGTVIHVRDVTEKTLMEQRLRRMERYMGLGSLAAGLQHEIKNPLSALSLHVQLLDEALNDNGTTPPIREMLEVLSAETRRMTEVLEGFRDFAAVSELNRSEFDPARLVTTMVRLVQPQAKQQSVRLETELPTTKPRPFNGDSVRIEQVLLNLVLNALDAMPESGVLTVRLNDSDTDVTFQVSDTGAGIPNDLLDKVFDPYFTTRATGTGMGLALCEKIVRQHDGNIDFQTGTTGTTFTVSLPRNTTLSRNTVS